MLADDHDDPPPVVVLQNGYDALRDLLRRGNSAREGRIGPLIRERVFGAFLSERCNFLYVWAPRGMRDSPKLGQFHSEFDKLNSTCVRCKISYANTFHKYKGKSHKLAVKLILVDNVKRKKEKHTWRLT